MAGSYQGSGREGVLGTEHRDPVVGTGNVAGLELRFSGELIRDGLRSKRGGQAWRSD